VLTRAYGTRTWRLGSLRGFGMSRQTSMTPLGGPVELLDSNRLAIVRPDGSLFASTPLPRDGHQADGPSSALVIAPDTRAVAFTVAFAGGTEVTYLLRAGARTAAPIHVAHVAFAPCERGAGLQWHGSWLLYSNTEGNLAVINSAAPHRSIELDSVVRDRLVWGPLGIPTGFDAYWDG
jgi:hypothetical protein